jgi:hypothetical protein
MSEGEVQPLQEGRVFCVNVLTIFWLRILTRERVKEVTQGRYEGWVGFQVRFFHYHKRVRELSAFPVRFFLDLEKS